MLEKLQQLYEQLKGCGGCAQRRAFLEKKIEELKAKLSPKEKEDASGNT